MESGRLVDLLWVEDDAADRELILELARSQLGGLAILALTDGHEALAWLRGRRREELPRVVVLDLHLPGLNGLRVLEHIRANPHTAALPVVIFTSSANPVQVGACYQAGANSYVVKPSNWEQYLRCFVQLATYWTRQNACYPPCFSE
ncbi:MAG: response regulator [Candidatus Binatia bacterium]|nr:response regulator [Candidatus Binatia bacterium]